MTPEGKIKAKVHKFLKRKDVWYFCPASNGYGRDGIPDFICNVNGRFLAIEIKRDETAKVTPSQKREIQAIRDTKGTALLVYDEQTLNDAKEGLLKLMES